MRSVDWLTLAAITLCAIGCNSGDPANSQAPSAPGNQAQGSNRTVADAPLGSHRGEPPQDESARVSRLPVQAPGSTATPQEVVHAFLEATRGGDDEVASSLLTRKAIEETTKRGLSVRPPGSASMHYTIGRTEPGPNNGVYVNSVWADKLEDGSPEEYQVVWILRQEPVGWRIAGMAVQMDEGADPLFVDFESPGELAQQMSGQGLAGEQSQPEAEQARRPEPGEDRAPLNGDPSAPNDTTCRPRVTPRIIIQEEEETKLGIDLGE